MTALSGGSGTRGDFNAEERGTQHAGHPPAEDKLSSLLAAEHVRYRAVWDYIRAVFGEVTVNELVLVGIIYLAVVAYSWAPRIGEAVGGMFDQDEE